MTDPYLLNYKIKESGYRFGFIADKMNISRTALYNKINGKTEFYASEIQSLLEILNLELEEKEKIFLTNKLPYRKLQVDREEGVWMIFIILGILMTVLIVLIRIIKIYGDWEEYKPFSECYGFTD